MIRNLDPANDRDLIWVQPAARKRAHELHAGDEVAATLTFQRGSLADAEAADHHWTFKREGFWHPRVTARVAGTDTNVTLFHPSWMGGGTLDLPDGHTLKLSSANIWRSEWVWREAEQPLVRFKSRQGLVKASAQVEISPEAAQRVDLVFLILLGWYLILLYAEDASTASIAATTVATTSV